MKVLQELIRELEKTVQQSKADRTNGRHATVKLYSRKLTLHSIAGDRKNATNARRSGRKSCRGLVHYAARCFELTPRFSKAIILNEELEEVMSLFKKKGNGNLVHCRNWVPLKKLPNNWRR